MLIPYCLEVTTHKCINWFPKYALKNRLAEGVSDETSSVAASNQISGTSGNSIRGLDPTGHPNHSISNSKYTSNRVHNFLPPVSESRQAIFGLVAKS